MRGGEEVRSGSDNRGIKRGKDQYLEYG